MAWFIVNVLKDLISVEDVVSRLHFNSDIHPLGADSRPVKVWLEEPNWRRRLAAYVMIKIFKNSRSFYSNREASPNERMHYAVY